MPNTVLVVDDETDILEVVSQNLNPLGCNVLQAVDVDIALQILMNNDVDLLISDIAMPERSGLDLVREVRKLIKFRNLPIILLTGYSTKENVSEAMALEVDGFIAKPYKQDHLRKMAKVLLETGRKKRADKSKAWEKNF